ncbi:hypothetical protein [Rhodobacter maris]|uniref:Uncharacterized protein n=1 Tax=Rhodobacter maris TaxID=446682 RepID=A0A285S5I6_9RHOB|nr:hypothetical protein [Rhodobacter maris]SOC00366.1 hypothetical protein SAMN05877831_102334 [Rhodobacter maris]
MQKYLFLHIGMPKCASTTIQANLEENAPALSERGYFYGKLPGDETVGQGNGTILNYFAESRKYAQFNAAVEYFLTPESHVILSGESLVALARSADVLEMISKKAHSKGFLLKVLCVLKRQDLWIESDFKQHVKGKTAWTAPIEKLVERRAEKRTLDYDFLLGNWTRAVPEENIRVRPVPANGENIDVVAEIADWLSVERSLFQGETGSRNVSPATALVEPARQLKKFWISAGDDVTTAAEKVAAFLEFGRTLDLPKRQYILSHAARREILDRYQAANSKVEKRFNGGRSLFDDVIEAEDHDATSLSEEAAQILIEYFVRKGEGEALGPAGPAREARTLMSSTRQRVKTLFGG